MADHFLKPFVYAKVDANITILIPWVGLIRVKYLQGQMNDASEVLSVIFACLHRSHTSEVRAVDTESEESNCMGSWDCTSDGCIAHTIFGMDINEQMNCCSCGLESRHFKYTSFFHNINANSLRTMKVCRL